MATGTGIGSGSCGASTGSQRCSFDTCAAYDCALGNRTNRSGPRRNVRLSQPFGSAAVMGRWDHCGNCDPTSLGTSTVSISRDLVLASGPTWVWETCGGGSYAGSVGDGGLTRARRAD